MVVFPAAAAAVSLLFAVILLKQWASRRRVAQLAWGIALLQFGIASVAVAAGVTGGWDPTLYRTYWLFGAMLNVPWLALGSIALLGRRMLTLVSAMAVVAGTAFAVARVALAPVSASIIGTLDIPRGRVAWVGDPSMRTIADYYSLAAYAVVVLIAISTSRARRGVRPSADRVRGNLLISSGVTIVAVGSAALARFARGSAFSVTLALGVTVMSVGFLYAGRAPRHHVTDPGDSPT